MPASAITGHGDADPNGVIVPRSKPVAVSTDVVTTAKPSSTRPFVQGGWDAYKLKAMEGRVLAAQVGAEDPPVRPHLPKDQPKG